MKNRLAVRDYSFSFSQYMYAFMHEVAKNTFNGLLSHAVVQSHFNACKDVHRVLQYERVSDD